MNHRYRLRVYYEDTDAGGVVYHANYLSFCSRARCEWVREAGVSLAQMQAEGMLMPVVSAALQYKAPAFLEDELLVLTRLIKVNRVSLVFLQQVTRYNTNELLCEATIKVACVDRDMRPQRIPQNLLKGVQ